MVWDSFWCHAWKHFGSIVSSLLAFHLERCSVILPSLFGEVFWCWGVPLNRFVFRQRHGRIQKIEWVGVISRFGISGASDSNEKG